MSIGSIAPIRSVMHLRYFENPDTFVTTVELHLRANLMTSNPSHRSTGPCDASPLRTNEAALAGRLTFSVVLHTDTNTYKICFHFHTTKTVLPELSLVVSYACALHVWEIDFHKCINVFSHSEIYFANLHMCEMKFPECEIKYHKPFLEVKVHACEMKFPKCEIKYHKRIFTFRI